MKSCDDCRFDHGSAECADCGPDQANYQPRADLAQIARDVQQRAEQLMGELTPDEEQKYDPRLVKQCLDANERGDGVLFATLNRGKYLYNVSVKDAKKESAWYKWGGHVWQRDDFSEVFNAVEAAALSYQQQAENLKGEIKDEEIDGKKHPSGWKISLMEKYKARADRLRSQNGAQKALHWAPIVDQTMAAREGDFNQRPWLLPCNNGVIDLKTGVLVQGRPCDLLNKQIDLDYDPHADYTPWQEFIEQICNDPEVAAFIKRSIGYAATGFSHEQFIWVFVGPGRNGKGTMFELIADILGPYYHEINRAMLIEQRNEPGPGAASEHKYSLLGKRLIIGAETNKGQKIDGSAVKSLTGEDRINCRPNFKSEIVFKPTHTLMLHTNHLPHGLTKDFAMRARLLKIEFPWRYVDDPDAEAEKDPANALSYRKKDRDLKDRLRQCKQGILRWIVEGCLEWQQNGLKPPECITKAVEDLTKEEDYLGQFIEDCLIYSPDPKDGCTKASLIYDWFTWWWAHNMDAQERRTPGMKSFTTQWRERYGAESAAKKNGQTVIYNHYLNDDLDLEVKEWLRKKRGSS